MPDETIITPIGTQKRIEAVKPKRSFARDIDWLVCVAAIAAALMTFGLSAYFFYGFTQTDTGFWTLASAFGLCFGVGALAYGPMAITAIIAQRSARGHASRKAFALALLLILPWVGVSLVFIGWSALPKTYGFTALLLSTSFSVWAFLRVLQQPKT